MSDPIKHVNSVEEFNNLLASTQYVIVDFYAEWCGPCKMIAPKYVELAEELSVPNYFAFAKIDVDKVQAVAKEHGITAMPTFIFFKDGQRVRVNDQLKIEGANPVRLRDAATKLGRLATEKAEAAGESK